MDSATKKDKIKFAIVIEQNKIVNADVSASFKMKGG